jgi:hypothetical protein
MPAFAFDADGLPVEISGGEEPLIDAETIRAGFSLFPPGKPAWEPAKLSRRIISPVLLSLVPLFFIIPALVRRKQNYR